MSRFYDLQISDPNTGLIWKPTTIGASGSNALGFTKSAGGSTFTSWVNGANDPGALNIEFDVVTYPFNTAQGGSSIRVHGVGLGMIAQASNLNGQNIKLSAGMKKGLPLATPSGSVAQAGVIIQGTILQAFGNWQGTNQYIDLIVNPLAAAPEQDISFVWPANSQLSAALNTTFLQAFAGLGMTAPKVTVSPLTAPVDEKGHYSTLASFAGALQELTQELGKPIYGDDYSGVSITIIGNTLYAYDNQTLPAPVQLSFFDLIGQPTWLGPATVSFKTVLRSDIAVGSQIKFPSQGVIAPYVLTSQAAALPNAPARSKSVFQGAFQVSEVHHFAHLRQADGDSWVSTYSAVAVPSDS